MTDLVPWLRTYALGDRDWNQSHVYRMINETRTNERQVYPSGKGTSQSQQRLSRRHRRRIRMTTNRQWRMDTVYPNSRDRHHSETSGSQLVDRCVRNLIFKNIYAAAMTITYLNWCYKDIFIYFFAIT